VGVVLFVMLVVGGCVALVGRAVLHLSHSAGHQVEDAKAASAAATKDVVITACESTTVGRDAKGTVVNRGARRSDFVIQVAFEGPTGQELDQGTAIVQNVDRDRSAQWSVVSRADRTSATGAVCRVVRVMRTASP
jgi:hypothetical protein